MTRAGLPTASECGGISLVTTEPAPIVQPSPMVTPGQIDGIAANPAIIANRDGFRYLESASLYDVQRMRSGVNMYAWAKKHVVANGDFHRIEHHTIEVEIDILACVNVVPIIAMKGRLYIQTLVRIGQQLLEKPACFAVYDILGIDLLQHFLGPQSLLHQLFVVAEIRIRQRAFFLFQKALSLCFNTKINKTMLYFLLNVRF